MGYIGSKPATNFETVRKQVSTTNSGTTITLDYSVSSVQDILVTVNAVVQSYDNYSVSGTTLTLGGTLNNDRVEILYVGRTFQTVSPAVGTVTNEMLSGSIANSKLANSSITLNGSAVSLGGSASFNTPAFEVVRNGNQSLTNDTVTKINFDLEQFDTDNAYDNSTNYRFTVPSGKSGKYFVYLKAGIEGASNSNIQYCSLRIRKNGTDIREDWKDLRSSGLRFITLSLNTTLDLAVGDYLEAYAYGNLSSGNPDIKADRGSGWKISVFGGYRIIGA